MNFALQKSTVRIFSDQQFDAFIIKNRKGSNVNLKLRCSFGRNAAAQLQGLWRALRSDIVKSRRRSRRSPEHAVCSDALEAVTLEAETKTWLKFRDRDFIKNSETEA